MKRALCAAALALLSLPALAVTTVPSGLINWAAPLPVANGGTGATSAATARTNLGLGTSATVSTGTSGATIPLLNGANTWASAQTFSVRPTFNGATPWDSSNLNIASYAPLASPTFTGTVTIPTGASITKPSIVGTVAADNASAGSVGEFISSSVASGSAVALTSNTPANITSITLTPGDWDVWGTICTNPAGTTTQSFLLGGINTTSATVPSGSSGAGIVFPIAVTAGNPVCLPVGTVRQNPSASLTVYLTINSTFATSTNSAYGFIAARRRR